MATITIEEVELDVIGKYKELLAASTDGDSSYLRAKETLYAMRERGEISEEAKSLALAQVVSQMQGQVMSTAMNGAISWAGNAVELYLKKLQMQKELDSIQADIDSKEASKNKTLNDDLANQATNIRMNGVSTVVDGKVVSLSDEGKVYNDILLSTQQRLNAVEENELIKSRVNESYAGIHKIVADTYNNHGMFSGYTVASNGVTGIIDNTPANKTTQNELQVVIAQEQAKGYTYNLWANTLNGLSSTIGIGLTSNIDIFGSATAPTVLADWNDLTAKMKNAVLPTF